MPMTVSIATNIRMKPARNWSWLFSAQQDRADGRQAQDQRHQHRARDEMRQEVADIGDEGIERHAERIFQERLARRQTFRLRGHVILLAELVEQVRTHAPDHGCGAAEADDEGRERSRWDSSDWILAQSRARPAILRIVEPADGNAEPAVHVDRAGSAPAGSSASASPI